MICYDDGPKPKWTGKPFDPDDYDANDKWLEHFTNSLTLTFFLQHGTPSERNQAKRELIVCDRKKAFWARQAKFDRDQMVRDAAAAKRRWR